MKRAPRGRPICIVPDVSSPAPIPITWVIGWRYAPRNEVAVNSGGKNGRNRHEQHQERNMSMAARMRRLRSRAITADEGLLRKFHKGRQRTLRDR